MCGSFEWNGKCGKFLLGQVYSAQGCGKCCEGGVGSLVVQVQPVPGWVSIERGTESCKFVCGVGILVVQVQPVPVWFQLNGEQKVASLLLVMCVARVVRGMVFGEASAVRSAGFGLPRFGLSVVFMIW